MASQPNDGTHHASMRWLDLRASWNSIRVFCEWAIRMETSRWGVRWNRIAILVPLILAGTFAAIAWPGYRQRNGIEAFRNLMFFVAATISFGGALYPARAACWELSHEMRDLVRLTGLSGSTLLWVKTMSRWWTLLWAILLILPLGLFARTLGSITEGRVVSAACGAMLLIVLVWSFGMLAGVLSAGAKNPEKTATSSTILWLYLYNLSYLVLSQVIHWACMLLMGGVSPEIVRIAKQLSLSGPAGSVSLALFQPDSFDPASTAFWIHFPVSLFVAVIATLLMEHRFRRSPESVDNTVKTSLFPKWFVNSRKSVRNTRLADGENAETLLNDHARASSHVELASSQHVHAPDTRRRPRCSDRPFLWKDIHILSHEGRFLNFWHVVHVGATLGVILLLGYGREFRDRDLFTATITGGVVAMVAMIISIRVDALLTAEFRERTWGSLMLLPVDPCHLLFSKVVAVVWEQRLAVMPIGFSVLFLCLTGSVQAFKIALMTSVMSFLTGAMLFQMSCISQLVGKKWWIGPLQIIGFVGLAVATAIMWVKCGTWIGFFLAGMIVTVAFLFVQCLIVQPLARNWSEP